MDALWHDAVKSNLCDQVKEAFKTQVEPTLWFFFLFFSVGHSCLHLYACVSVSIIFTHTQHAITQGEHVQLLWSWRFSITVWLPFEYECISKLFPQTEVSLPLCHDFQDRSFFQCSAPLHPHLKELWSREHQGLLHRSEGRILRGQSELQSVKRNCLQKKTWVCWVLLVPLFLWSSKIPLYVVAKLGMGPTGEG